MGRGVEVIVGFGVAVWIRVVGVGLDITLVGDGIRVSDARGEMVSVGSGLGLGVGLERGADLQETKRMVNTQKMITHGNFFMAQPCLCD